MTLLEDASFPLGLLQAHDHALIDRYVIGDALRDIAAIAPELWPVVPAGMEADADKFPALLPLAALGDDARQALFALLEHAHDAQAALPIVCLFKSSASVKQLRWHWMQQMVVQTAQGKKFQLRSYVPSVFVQLQRFYTPAQLKALFGDISVWSIYHDQRWHSLDAPDGLPTQSHLIGESQLEQLLRVQAINRTLAELNVQQDGDQMDGSVRPHYRGADPAGYFAISNTIDELIVRAQTHGLAREDDQVQFALHGLSQHPHFDTHPRIRKLLSEMDSEEQTYLDATALLQPDDWQRIQTDLQSTAPNKA